MAEKFKKILVTYKSKYGSTKRYAEWIAEEVKGDLLEVSNVKVKDLEKYDIIVFGGSLHAVGINGIKVIINNYKNIMDKKIIVFTVGCSPERDETIKHIFSSNFADEMKERINFFYLRGAFDYSKLNLADKMMMQALKLKLKKIKEEDLDEDSRGLLKCYDNPVDWTDRKSIGPIVECINK